MENREMIGTIAREDEDPRVRRAAVSKLMDSTALAGVARDDKDETVRAAASSMLRDIALEAFEGLTEADSMDAVDAMADARALTQIARTATRDVIALRALSRVQETHSLGSIARHAASEAARLGALDGLRERSDRAEILAVALNGEHQDAAIAAVDLVTDRQELEQIAARAKSKGACRRARLALRAAETSSPPAIDVEPLTIGAREVPFVASRDVPTNGRGELHADGIHLPQGGFDAEAGRGRGEEPVRLDGVEAVEPARPEAVPEAPGRENERKGARLAELAEIMARAAAAADLEAARKVLALTRAEWADLGGGAAVDPQVSSCYAEAEARLIARIAAADAGDARSRRETLTRLQHLLVRVETLSEKPDLSLKAAARALRTVRAALAPLPPLPSRQDADEVTRRLKAAQGALGARVQELRAAGEWQRWANVAVQEQLIARMEALSALEDPDAIAREVRSLQQQWRQVADVPRAQADVLWRRFKAAHDAVWPRCEAHFSAQAEVRSGNMAKKVALCDKVEALADSTHWIQTAEEIKRLQAEWKTIGPVSRGDEKVVWERFRSACDRFFTRRQTDLAARKKLWAENLVKKDALVARAEALADSTEWDEAAAVLRRLQAEWKLVGPVKKSRSDAIWRRFHDACNRFFIRYAQRHDAARAEKIAAREAICAEVESLALPADISAAPDSPPADLLARAREVRTRWLRETAERGADGDHGRALDARFATAFEQVLSRWPSVFAGTDLDAGANRSEMERLVKRAEALVSSLSGPDGKGAADTFSPTTRLAAMLKEALAANTIGGKLEDNSHKRAAVDEVRQLQVEWARIGLVPEDARRALADRFRRACRQVVERADVGRATGGAPGYLVAGSSGRPGGAGADPTR